MSKIYIENSIFMEYIDELATQITKMNYGAETFTDLPEDECTSQDTVRFTDEAQDYYNEMYDEFETLTNNLLGVYSNNELNKNKIMGKLQYKIEHLIEDDVINTEIEFTEEKAIETAKKILDNPSREGYCLISMLEQEENGSYSTIEQNYITINK